MAVGEAVRRRACRRRGRISEKSISRRLACFEGAKSDASLTPIRPNADTPTRFFRPPPTRFCLRRILPPCLARLVKKQATLVVGNILLRPEQNRLLLPFLRRTEIPAFGVGGG